MFVALGRFLRWLFEKFAAAVLIAGLALAACALWLFLKDNVDFDEWRRDLLREVNGERAKVQSALADVHRRMDRTAAEITAEQDKGKQTDRIIAQLRDLESTWDKYVGNPAQQKANAEQIAKLTASRVDITRRVQALQQEFTRTTYERDGLEIALGKLDARVRAIEAQQSRVLHYLERAWNHRLGRGWIVLPVKWWIYLVLGFYLVGPTAGKITLFFFVAPWIARRPAVRLAPACAALPEAAATGVSADIVLREGERLVVREKFLQTSDEGLARRTRALLDWRMPLTCLAAGLTELIEMRHAAGLAGQHVTLSNQADPHSELAVLTLPAGAALVLRPSFLAGAILPAGGKLRVRRRWQLFRWQAWMTLQFRFFEFAGPCRLIVAGTRGVRVERLESPEGGAPPARRTNQDATVGFTPNLDYRPARAETFWSYYRGMNPLFDDLFVGRGLFLCQQVASDGEAKRARKFWSGVWSGVMKVFGL